MFYKRGDGIRAICKSCYQLKYTKSNRLNDYKITSEDFDRMRNEQNNCCKICMSVFSEDRKTFVDHNHESGVVRGLLCPSCNTGIGLFKEDCNLMARAIKYIKGE